MGNQCMLCQNTSQANSQLYFYERNSIPVLTNIGEVEKQTSVELKMINQPNQQNINQTANYFTKRTISKKWNIKEEDVIYEQICQSSANFSILASLRISQSEENIHIISSYPQSTVPNSKKTVQENRDHPNSIYSSSPIYFFNNDPSIKQTIYTQNQNNFQSLVGRTSNTKLNY